MVIGVVTDRIRPVIGDTVFDDDEAFRSAVNTASVVIGTPDIERDIELKIGPIGDIEVPEIFGVTIGSSIIPFIIPDFRR